MVPMLPTVPMLPMVPMVPIVPMVPMGPMVPVVPIVPMVPMVPIAFAYDAHISLNIYSCICRILGKRACKYQLPFTMVVQPLC